MESLLTDPHEFKLTEENIELARQISNKFNIPELKEKCEEWTRNNQAIRKNSNNSAVAAINTKIDSPPFDPQWTLWQFIDSSFPSGAFMHSGGLEAAFRAELPGVTWTTDTLTQYLRLYVQQTAGTLLPIVREAFVHGEDLLKYAELDLLAEQCTVSNHVTHRASTAMGMSLIITAVNCFPHNRLKEVKAFINAYEHPSPVEVSPGVSVARVTKAVQGHFAPLFGLICKRLDLEQDHVRIGHVFMYASLRAVVSAAVRLNMIGPIEGQRVQASCYHLAQQIVVAHIDRPLALLGQTCPLLDIIQGSHDTLYSRMFNTDLACLQQQIRLTEISVTAVMKVSTKDFEQSGIISKFIIWSKQHERYSIGSTKMSVSQAAGEGTSTKDSTHTSTAPVTDEAGSEVISPRRMKYALKKENSTAEGYVSMIRSKSDRHMHANSVTGSAEVKLVRQSSSEALVGGGDKKSSGDPEGEVRPRAQTVGTVAVDSTVKQSSPRGEAEPPKTARADLEVKRDRKEKEKDKEKEKEKHKRTHTKKPSALNLTLEPVKPTTTTATSTGSKHESKRDKKDKKDKKDKHTKRSETIASPRHHPAQVANEEPKVRFGEPQIKFTEPARETVTPVVVDTPKAPSAPQLLTTSTISGPVVDLFVDHLIAQKGPLKKSIDQLIQTLLQEHEQATSKQLSDMKSKIEELTSENAKLKQELEALKKK